MRQIVRFEIGRCGTAAPSAPERTSECRPERPKAGHFGTESMMDTTCLLPGGMTKAAYPENPGNFPASGPEPAIGYGAAKGLPEYYRAVIMFEKMPDTP